MTARIFDDRPCTLGEGPFWHPERGQFFWFDIIGMRLLTRSGEGPQEWGFSEHVSAAGWIDRDRILIASETALFAFDLETSAREDIVALDAENSITRSNDGRADRQGGFWIGTMGKSAEPGQGAIYRYYKGVLEKLVPDITIPNAICFAPDGRRAYYADTADARIMTLSLDEAGWPTGNPEVFADLRSDGLNPDGAIVDAEGCVWNAQWGAGRVARYSPEGEFMTAIDVPGAHATCPAIGGEGMNEMIVTTAREGRDPVTQADGLTYLVEPGVKGLPEARVIL